MRERRRRLCFEEQGGPLRHAEFIMSDMKQGIENIQEIEEAAPSLAKPEWPSRQHHVAEASEEAGEDLVPALEQFGNVICFVSPGDRDLVPRPFAGFFPVCLADGLLRHPGEGRATRIATTELHKWKSPNQGRTLSEF